MTLLVLLAAVPLALIPSLTRAETLNLTMKQAVKLGVERNLALKAYVYDAAITETGLRGSRGIYNPGLSLGVAFRDAESFAANVGGPSEEKSVKLTAGLNRLIRSGATIGIQFNNYYNETNYTSSLYPHYWQSELTLTMSQPLLRNFGEKITNVNIVLSEQAWEGALQHLAARIQSLIAQIRVEYVKLHSLREDLMSRKVSLDLARKILVEIRERVSAGVLPQMEILNAQYGVAAREKEVIDAEKGVKDQVDLLRQLLQIEAAEINAVDPPDLEPVPADEKEAIRRALEQRPELAEARIQIAGAETQRGAARNKTLPALNAYGSWTAGGLGREYYQDLNRVGTLDYPVWTAGLQFEYPLGNDTAEADYVKSKLKLEQTRNQLENLTSQVVTDVRAALRSVEANYKQLDVTAREKAFADERLSAYISKSEVGLATARDVLDVENDLARARSNEIRAQVNYVIAVTQLLQATGQLLEREGIKVNGKTVEQLRRVEEKDEPAIAPAYDPTDDWESW